MNIQIPTQIRKWLFSVFSDCNHRVAAKLSNIPNAPETSLDLSFIEYLSQFATAKAFSGSWFVRIDTHYIGGLRHYHGWEIADICILIYFKTGNKIQRSKVALLQSKRLYPINERVKQEVGSDFLIGISVLADPEFLREPLTKEETFVFNSESKYGALIINDDQWRAIRKYCSENKIPVYYLLYNPWTLPFTQKIPLSNFSVPSEPCSLGLRVLPYENVRSHFSSVRSLVSPKIKQVENILSDYKYGWRLEDFMMRLLDCQEGHVFTSANQENIQNLFYRKSGTVAAVIAISIEMPE